MAQLSDAKQKQKKELILLFSRSVLSLSPIYVFFPLLPLLLGFFCSGYMARGSGTERLGTLLEPGGNLELTPRPSKTPYLQIQLPPRSCLEPPLIPVLVSSIKWVAKGPWQSPICQAIKSPGFVPRVKALLPFWGFLKWKASKKNLYTKVLGGLCGTRRQGVGPGRASHGDLVPSRLGFLYPRVIFIGVGWI